MFEKSLPEVLGNIQISSNMTFDRSDFDIQARF